MPRRPSVDTSALDYYLQSENERLEAQLDYDTDNTGTPLFSPAWYFDDINNKFYKKRKKYGLTIDIIADKLDTHIPGLLQVLDRKGDEYGKLNLFGNWINFLRNKALNRERLLMTLTREAGALLAHEKSSKRSNIAFHILVDTVNLCAPIRDDTLSPDVRGDMTQLIMDEAPAVLKNTLMISPDCLSRDEITRITVAKEGYQEHYYSYSENVRYTYANCLTILSNMGTTANVVDFIYATQPDLSSQMVDGKKGYGLTPLLETKKRKKEILKQDTENSSKCFDAALQCLRRRKVPDIIDKYVNDHAPFLMHELMEQNDTAQQLMVYQSSLEALGARREMKRREFACIGAYGIVDLVGHNDLHEAATMLAIMKNEIGVNQDEVLVVFNPSDKEQKRPVAAMFEFQKKDMESSRLKGSVALLLGDDSKKLYSKPWKVSIDRLADIICNKDGLTESFGYVDEESEDVLPDGRERNIVRAQAFSINKAIAGDSWRNYATNVADKNYLYVCPVHAFLR
jgi:hypothetical protein